MPDRRATCSSSLRCHPRLSTLRPTTHRLPACHRTNSEKYEKDGGSLPISSCVNYVAERGSILDRVVLQVDTSQPLLRPSQLTALVRAVRDADSHDEHRWIEWKSGLDLTTAAGQGHIAKAVLGLANRQPAAAAHHAGGYGYLLVGVEPGAIFVRHTGRTDPATPADLDMLQARLLERTPSLQMTVAAKPSTIETLPDIFAAAGQWVERRRPALLAARYQPPAPQAPAIENLTHSLGQARSMPSRRRSNRTSARRSNTPARSSSCGSGEGRPRRPGRVGPVPAHTRPTTRRDNEPDRPRLHGYPARRPRAGRR